MPKLVKKAVVQKTLSYLNYLGCTQTPQTLPKRVLRAYRAQLVRGQLKGHLVSQLPVFNRQALALSQARASQALASIASQGLNPGPQSRPRIEMKRRR